MATMLPGRLLDALNRFNAAHPWDHNAHYHPWLLRQLPRRFGRALDVGCGSGDLVRALAGRAGAVHGVDADAGILRRARELTPDSDHVTYTLADAAQGLPTGPYDVITCVAVLHHLPFADTLTRVREELAPRGTVVVVGCARAASAVDHVLGLVAIPLNAATGWVKNRGRSGVRPVSMSARVHDPEMNFAEIAAEARRILPGARVRRRLFWRYTLVWRAPGRA
ncbi:methyltransferase domain-containing protein [Streptomyces sp. NPDC047028]|uniref:methyltransferase domain-containing protein n=1 Tax=Streptomyces sp. NPDC047028 TaxID=3155793 RepID=UPI003401F2D9